jgi:repressor LexA
MLTKKQYELLVFINRRLEEAGVSPSFDEMKDALGLRSKSGIHRLITGLEERGFVRRLPHRARALEVLRVPARLSNGDHSAETGGRKSLAPNVIKADFKGAHQRPASAPAVELPIYGRIAAGTPIEALRDQTASIEVPVFLLDKGEHYALEVDGDSMVDAGIHDGDTAIIQRTDVAENGSIVVALVDNEEVTLKRLRRRGQSVALEPANSSYETRICGPDQVKVQGRLVGLMRKY